MLSFYLYRVEHLSTFFVQWSPNIYSKDNKKPRQSQSYLIKEQHQKHYLVVKKNNLAAINKLLINPVDPSAEDWPVRVGQHKDLITE